MKFKIFITLSVLLFGITIAVGQDKKSQEYDLNPGENISLKTFRLTREATKTLKTITPTETTNTSSGSAKAAATYDAGSITSSEDVSQTGAFTYTIPIKTPPGIKQISPSVSLHYNGQGGNGLPGFGWNLSGVSTITRIGASLHHDGEIDPVDFDQKDRFILDGQRLILISGTYGASGSEYRTETYSNLKVKAYGTSPYGAAYGPAYFIVFYPDGNIAWSSARPGQKKGVGPG